MPKCLLCKNEVQENLYHRAIKAGAIWFCFKCDIHLDEKLKAVIMQCRCGCKWNNRIEAITYNAKIIAKSILGDKLNKQNCDYGLI